MKSETIDGFHNFCLIFGRALNLFFNASLVICSFSIDHSDAISKGVLSFSPRAQLLSCWPHLRRKCREKKNLLNNVDHYDTMMKNIDFLHQSSSRKMFKFLSEIMIEHWVMVFGEEKYAT